MSSQDVDQQEDAFYEICKRADGFLNEFRGHSEKMVEGLTLMQVSALTAAIHSKVDCQLWASYNRLKRKNNEKLSTHVGESSPEQPGQD